ncbi:deubiquitinase otu-like isoform X2 [Chironomus tepperi]|uniref:deubiquitinase otu-like isoform X2 n=1 Tax=Chironomus tepperi TaxID=113505 RepID=UPI00391F5F66
MQDKKKIDKIEKDDDNKPNRRPFATGSKPGPDELDHYLEERGFYRKHVARDASSLFRVVSEQVFDIQNYHDKVRQDCATFMELNIKDYANEVDKNFYNYVSNLRRSRTYGTLLELRVIARMYKRNIILFEPNQNMETMHRDFIKDDDYKEKEPIRVFYSHKDKHFDTIYPMETVESLAECQSIVYEILYTDVFKLPDVKYAVERMLHDQDEQSTLPLEEDPTKYKNANGDIHEFDGHEETNCVLKDPRTCHFHNQEDFEEVVNENKDAITIINRSDDPGKLKIFKPVDGFLYKSDKSCVRQLLDEKITPFPYKVAKALDPSIYRNTEFELWSENRKEQRMKWFDANGLPLRENDDRHWPYYGDFDKNRRFDSMKYSFQDPMINEDSILGLDDDGKKKFIMSNDEYKLGQLTNFDHFQPPRSALDQIIMPVHVHHRPNFRGNNRRYNHRGFNNNNNNNMHHNQSHHPQNNNNNMNYVGDIERENMQYNNEQEPMYPPPQNPQPPIFQEMPGNYQFVQYDQQSPPPMYQPTSQYQYIPTSPYQQPIPTVQYQPPMVPYTYPQPALISYQQPPTQQPVNNPAGHHSNEQRDNNNRDTLNLIRDNELNSPINWSPQESIDLNGNDLPLNDLATMQFYYNLGVRYFFASGISRRLENVANQLETLDINASSHSQDPPPVPVNTPVSTKPGSSGQSGHRYPHNNSNNSMNNRRVFHNSQSNSGNKDKGRIQHNHQRKEIQFNSNVKNVHKADQNKSGTSQVSSQNSSAEAQNQEQQVPQMVQMQTPQPQVQYFQQFPQQGMIAQPPQPLICYQTENGELMPLTPAVQPIYYGYQPAPQTPVYYQTQPQILDGTVNSTDSGIVDFTGYTFQQPAYPIIYQPPTPIYYPQTPMIQTTPQLAPVYPVAFNGTPIAQQSSSSHQDTLTQQSNESNSTGLNETSNTNVNNANSSN